jgi:hypothetical protein
MKKGIKGSFSTKNLLMHLKNLNLTLLRITSHLIMTISLRRKWIITTSSKKPLMDVFMP